MKTLHQRLQSRISRRRNFIRREEDVLAALKQQRRNIRLAASLMGIEIDMDGINEEIDDLRGELRMLSDDQRLDKKLKSVITEQDTLRRFYDLPNLS